MSDNNDNKVDYLSTNNLWSKVVKESLQEDSVQTFSQRMAESNAYMEELLSVFDNGNKLKEILKAQTPSWSITPPLAQNSQTMEQNPTNTPEKAAKKTEEKATDWDNKKSAAQRLESFGIDSLGANKMLRDMGLIKANDTHFYRQSELKKLVNNANITEEQKKIIQEWANDRDARVASMLNYNKNNKASQKNNKVEKPVIKEEQNIDESKENPIKVKSKSLLKKDVHQEQQASTELLQETTIAQTPEQKTTISPSPKQEATTLDIAKAFDEEIRKYETKNEGNAYASVSRSSSYSNNKILTTLTNKNGEKLTRVKDNKTGEHLIVFTQADGKKVSLSSNDYKGSGVSDEEAKKNIELKYAKLAKLLEHSR